MNKERIKKSFENGFLDTIKYDGFRVEFSTLCSSDNGENANVECTYEFAFRQLNLIDQLKSMGGTVDEDGAIKINYEDKMNELEIYHNGSDSACVAIDGFRTLYFDETNAAQAKSMGVSLANTCNRAITRIKTATQVQSSS